MSNNKKHLGILELGNRSTLFYINQINNAYQAVYGGFSTCPFIMYNENFDKFNPYLPNQFDSILPVLKQSIKTIETLNIKYLLIPNITLHESLDQISTRLKVAHPVELSIQALNRRKHKKVTILGTKYTMNASYIKDSFSKNGIEVIKPTESEQEIVEELRKALYEERESLHQVKLYNEIVLKYIENTPVLIACTELSSISTNENSMIFDMAKLQIASFIKQLNYGKNIKLWKK